MEINLLPWREEIFEYNRKLFARLILIAVVAGGLFLFAVSQIFFKELSYLKSYTAALESAKISLLHNTGSYLKDKKTYEEIATRLLALRKIQNARFETIRLLNEIAKITPKGLYLSKLTRTDNEVELSGSANSNLLVSQFLKSIDDSPDLDVISLQKVEKTEGKDLFVTQFSLKALLTMSPDAAVPAPKEKSSISNPISIIKELKGEQTKKIDDALKGKP